MAISEDVQEIIQVLIAEGFGVIAGELLAEISTRADGDLPFDENAEADETKLITQAPLAEDEQLGEAFRILRLRLIEPARHLAESERIGGVLADRKPVRIRFVGPDGSERRRTGPCSGGRQ